MRLISKVVPLAALYLGLSFSALAMASEETRLLESINSYRSQAQPCGGQASAELPPLASDPRLLMPVSNTTDLQQAMTRASYPMVTVQAITLSGPRDAAAAMQAIQESFCQVVLDPQFVDIGISRENRDWRIVLARPLLTSRLRDWQSEGQALLSFINTARGQARQCGTQSFEAAQPLTWNTSLAGAAESHSRAMANNNFFDHKGRNGDTPGDRAELAGYLAQQIGENIAAGQDNARKVVDGWLASPGHCATLMSPAYRELGAAYAADPKSDAGIYWTAMFGAPSGNGGE
ncbi:CAP domain-containing protein [Pseudomonas sp. DTU_2021_1001937_2_SI_NGA_ILE_001]|uniref:CAP domain-containing protein n=1 Tax=Pseudomonas sp. DTU_2021_1001937_2_SI_NGA_ILE_001 TaxID=3077589 RepID=UPI0025ECEA90|nr:CAP domain-containing protein [Pseudomonas sp. DTU_2021_1001937_2_SI_NGA_ILE_001]WNW09604.1 CAP domain-containing protein [Pseudomonas sp. DTU_2021_1001937_2_SI_NGA_ILE_001]